MRKFSIFAAVVVSLSAIYPASTCQAQWPGATRGKEPKHVLEIGGGGFHRPGQDSGIAVITDAETGETLFDTEDATSVGGAAGLDIRYQFESPGGRKLRFRSIVADFDNSNEIFGVAGLESPLLELPTDRVLYEYDSRILSFELMSVRNLAPGINFVAGPRYISFREEVSTEVDGEFDPGDGTIPLDATNVNSIDADNGLIGLQAGLEINFPVSRYLRGETFIRTGGFYNPTEVTQSSQQTVGGLLIPATQLGDRNTKSTGSFLGEVGGRLFFDFIPDTVAGYVGYEATWIDGIALAPAQLTAAAATVDTANTVFFQAFTFGVRMQF